MFEEVVQGLFKGTVLIMTPSVLLMIISGVGMGLFFGAIPGLTTVLAMVLLLPLTYGIPAIEGFALLIAVYIGGITGGLVSAIMIGIPGTAASIVTTFDGYPMAKRGEAGRALGLGFAASFFGGLIGWFFLVLLTPQLAQFAISIRSTDYTMIILFGFFFITVTASKDLTKSFLMTTIGCILAAIGMDPLHGTSRLTMGTTLLEGGIGLVPLLSGIYVVSRAMEESETITIQYISPPGALTNMFSQILEIWRSWGNLLRSSIIGILIGILPGIGAAVAPFISYDQAKKWSKHKDNFGHGEPDGIIASEACNNATIGGALIPGLALGIPGDVPVVILLGGFILKGFQPGPLFFTENLDLVYSIFVAYFLANLVMLIIGLTVGVRIFSRVLSVKKVFLIPIILIAGVIGSYNIGYSMDDVWVCLAGGMLGYLAIKAEYPITPLVISIILGPMFENNLRIAMSVSKGSLLPFVQRPVSLLFLVLTVLTVLVVLWNRRQHSE